MIAPQDRLGGHSSDFFGTKLVQEGFFPHILRLLADSPWPLSDGIHLLSPGCFLVTGYDGLAPEAQVLRDRGLLNSVILRLLHAINLNSHKIYY